MTFDNPALLEMDTTTPRDRATLIRAIAAAAVDAAVAADDDDITGLSLLKAIRSSNYTLFPGGRVVVSTNAAGGTVTFAYPSYADPHGILILTQEAIELLEAQADPMAPNFKRIGRLRAGFRKSKVS